MRSLIQVEAIEQYMYFPVVLFIIFIMLYSVTIQMKANKQYFPVVQYTV